MDSTIQKKEYTEYLVDAKQHLKMEKYNDFFMSISLARYMAEDRDQKIEVVDLLIRGFYQKRDYQQAYQTIQNVLELVKDDNDKIRFRQWKALILVKMDRLKEGVALLKKIINQSQHNIDNLNTLMEVYIQFYKKYSNNDYLEQGISYGLAAVEEIQKDDGIISHGSVYINLGNCYWYQENYKRALEYYHRALDSEEELINIQALINIGAVYVKLKDLDKADYNLNRAEQVGQKKKNYYLLGEINLLRANIYQHYYEDYMKAKEYLLIAFDHFVQADALLKSYQCLENIFTLNGTLNRESINILADRVRDNQHLKGDTLISLPF